MRTTILLLISMITAQQVSAQTTWYEVPSGTTKKLNVIDFPSAQVGYIGGNDSLILKSTDGGVTWNELSYTGVSFALGGEHILNLKFVSEDIGYMTVGPYTGTFKTTDGGNTWSQVTFAGIMCYNQGMYFFGEGNGFVGGSGCFQGEHIERSVFGSFSETVVNTPSWMATDLVVDIDFDLNQFGQFGLAASAGGRILRTTDGGQNWDTISSGLPAGVPLTSIAIVNDTLAYAGYDDLGTGFGVLMSTDAGSTWSMDINSATFYYPAYHDVHVTGGLIAYSGAEPSFSDDGLILERDVNGNWNYYNVDHPIFNLTSYGDSTVWAVGDSGYVVVNVPIGSLSAPNYETQIEMSLFPNPAKDMINIQSPDLLALQKGQITILTIDGRIVKTTAFSTSTDISDLPLGMYLLQVAHEDQITTQKFIKQ